MPTRVSLWLRGAKQIKTGKPDAEREQEAGCKQAENEGVMEDTLFLQSRTGVLKVQVTVTPFPVVAAPPATGGAP